MNKAIVNRAALGRIIRRFGKKKVLVLGDLMLDRYIWGDVSRISPEAPVPVVEVRSDSLQLGGAGNVAHNLESLGAAPLLAGIVGNDPEGRWIRSRMGAGGKGILVDARRPTIVKTRIVAHHQQVVRVDLERRGALPEGLAASLAKFVRDADYDGLLISDYNKGIVNPVLMAGALAAAAERKAPVFVDPKVENFRLFSPVTLITPNHFEAEKVVGHPCRTDAEVERAGTEIMGLISCRYLIIKRGEQGMTVCQKGKTPIHIPTVAREVFDDTGAGDTVIAAAALALLAGGTIEQAAVIANAAAGIVVGKIGTATTTSEELLAAL
jgi:D-beta-D-heptose 7-phosphate kinase/D-beta-D-heptose 1-phosphate adenosyltransferase